MSNECRNCSSNKSADGDRSEERRFNTTKGDYCTIDNNFCGHGASGHVFLCNFVGDAVGVNLETSSSSESQPPKLVAIKSFDNFLNGQAAIERAMATEILALKSITHPNIVKLLDEGPNFLIFDYWPKTLFSLLEHDGILLVESSANGILFQLIHAMGAVHRAGFAHLDIKPENILIELLSPQEEAFKVALADFGCAQHIKGGARRIRGLCGSTQYRAPEVSSKHRYYPAPCDVWSLACIYFVMLNGSPPFEDTYQCPYFQLVKCGNWQQFWNSHEHISGRFIPMSAKSNFQRLLGPRAIHRPLINELAQEII